MTQFIRDKAGVTETQQKIALAYLFKQDFPGSASNGVLTGLLVSQTATASAAVRVSQGVGIVQQSTFSGVSMMVLDAELATFDVLTANPVGGLPRNDIIVFDSATISGGSGGIRTIVGTPNASPTDPTVPTTAIPLARLRHAASATTIPAAKIDSLVVQTNLFGAASLDYRIHGIPFAGASTSKAGKRLHWGSYTSVDVSRSDADGIQAGIPHGAGFTPSQIIITPKSVALQFRAFNLTATTFDLQVVNSDGSANGTTTFSFDYLVGE